MMFDQLIQFIEIHIGKTERSDCQSAARAVPQFGVTTCEAALAKEQDCRDDIVTPMLMKNNFFTEPQPTRVLHLSGQ